MTNFYLGQIDMFGFNFAPRGWAFCNNQILPLAQNTALFSLLGTTYGGNGQSTFGLPDYRSRTPRGMGTLTSQGELAGLETVTLLNTEMPSHTHNVAATSTAGNIPGEAGHLFAKGESGSPVADTNAYLLNGVPNLVLNPQGTSLAGGSQPHNNLQPLLAINFCIATVGIYPSRN
jgi:microcystin-dependent protein